MPFHPKIPCIFLLLALCLAAGLAHGQTNFSNPSFEGTTGAGVAPPGWFICQDSPDILPGTWGVTLPAANGNTYMGLLTGGTIKESVGQPFVFTAGVTFSFSVNLARSAFYYDTNYGQAGRLNVWVGTSDCAKSLLLWTSPIVTDAWQNHTFSFTPTINYTYLRIEAEYPGGAMQECNVLVDNLQIGCNVPSTTPTVAAAGTLATQNRVWQLDQALNLLTNATVTGVPAAEVKWTAEFQRNGQTEFTRVIGNPSAYRFEAPGTVVLRPTYFCGGNAVNFAAPLTITVQDGFNQKIDVNWPGAHIDIAVVCEVSVRRGGMIYFKGTTSSEGKLYVEGIRNGDQLLVKSTKIANPYASATYNVTFSAEQTTPLVINLSPDFVDAGL